MKKVLLMLPLLALTGCFFNQPTVDPNRMTYEESQNISKIERGVILSVEKTIVKIDGSNETAVGGAIVGGIAGSQVSAGSGRDVAIAVGALAGAAVGKVLSGKEEEAYVYTVESKTGKMTQVVQGGEIIPVATKVLIKHYGDRKTISVDQSQGATFSRTEKTKYDGPDDSPVEERIYQYDNEELYSPEDW